MSTMTTQNYDSSNIGSGKLTISDVVNKMYNQAWGILTKGNLQTAAFTTSVFMYDASKNYVKTFGKTLMIPFLVPTWLRTDDPWSIDFDGIGKFLGSLAGTLSGIQGWMLTPGALNEHIGDRFWYSYIGANVISGLYEWYRHTKNKMAEQNIENQVLIEPNNKLEIAPPHEVNQEDEKSKDIMIKASLKLEELAKELQEAKYS